MKQSQIFILIAVLLSVFLLTGFQCGSTQLTSAKLYEKNGDNVSAEKAYEKEVATNPLNGEAWFALGRVRYALGKYEAMNDAFTECLKTGNTYATEIATMRKNGWGMLLNKGAAFYNRIQAAPADSQKILASAARESYEQATKILPDSALAYEYIARTYLIEKNWDNQIAYLQKARDRKKDPAYSADIINTYLKKVEEERSKGDTVAANKDIDQAIAEVQEARKSDPDNKELLTTMINLYITAGKSKDAVPYIKEAVDKDPSNKVFQNDLGLLLMQDNKYEEAISHIDAAVATDSSYEDALRNGAVAYMKLGEQIRQQSSEKEGSKGTSKPGLDKFKKAVTLLEKLTSQKPDDANLWDGLATAYANANMLKNAEKAMKKADSLRKK